jgi:hypothetical protein
VPPTLTSTANPLVKRLARLQDARARREEGLFLVEGRRAIETFLDSGWKPEHLLLREDEAPPTGWEDATLVSERVLGRVSQAASPSGYLAAFRLRDRTPPDPALGGLAVAELGDPGNLGTLARTAAAMGVAQLAVIGGADPWSPKSVQASAGALARLRVHELSIADGLEPLAGGAPLCALVPRGGEPPERLPRGTLAGGRRRGQWAARAVDRALRRAPDPADARRHREPQRRHRRRDRLLSAAAGGRMSERLDGSRRDELVRLLEERARLLAPPADLVERAIARCIRHDLRQERGAESARLRAAEATAAAPVAAPPEVDATPSDAATDESPISNATVPDLSEEETPETGKTVADSGAQSPVAVGDGLSRGRIVAGYRIEGLLGKGGMGQVYRAVQLSVDREVAFKVLSPRLAADKDFRERFLREARAAGRLHHPNLIGVHDVGEANGLMFFSMELIEGRTVKDLITRDGAIPLERALDIVAQALGALQYAHERGVVHRDIKPDNIMVTDSGLVKIADLGLSRIESMSAEESASASTQAGTIMGTPHYMSPEQGRDAHAADARSDIYSLGATLYHMLCGRTPFIGTSPVDVVMKAATQPVTFPDPGPGAGARQLINRLMAKRPEDRPQTSAEALALVDRLRKGSTIGHSHGRMHRIGLRRSRLRSLLPLLVVALLSVAAVIAVIAYARHHADEQAWASKLGRINASAASNDFRRAVDLAQADLQELPPDSARHRELEALLDDLQQRWSAWSGMTIAPVLTQSEAALRDHRLQDASHLLKVENEDGLSPDARKQLEDRRDLLEHAIDDLLARPPEAKPSEETVRVVEQGRKLKQERFASVMWRGFAWNPTAAAERVDAGMLLHGSGAGAMTFPQPRLLGRAEVREIDLALRFSAPPESGERWTLSIGRARLDVMPSGVTATAVDGRVEQLSSTKTDGTLRVRRLNGELQVSAKQETWISLGQVDTDARLQMAWELVKDHTLEMGLLPVFERAIK